MNRFTTHYSLFTQSNAEDQLGRWRFVLRPQCNNHDSGGDSPPATTFEAGGTEEDVRGERLDLLCVVRGLEALDRPSRVTLITSSTYVREGIRYGLDKWRKNGWRWESFGKMAPIKNRDLWQRVDTALRYHCLECRTWRFDAAHEQITQRDSSEKEQITGEMPNRRPAAEWSMCRVVGLYRRLKHAAMRWLVSVPQCAIEGTADLKHAVRAQ